MPPHAVISASYARVTTAFGIALLLAGTYNAGVARRSVRRLLMAASVGAALLVWSELWISPFSAILDFVLLTCAATLVFALERTSIDLLYRRTRLARARATSSCLLIGLPNSIAAVRRSLSGTDGLTIVGQLSPLPSGDLPWENGGIERLACDAGADTLLVCGPLTDSAFRRVIRASTALNTQVLTFSTRVEQTGVHPSVVWKGGTPMLSWKRPTLRSVQLTVKRLLDIFGATFALVISAPLMTGIAVAVRLLTRGPVFFAQDRLGRHAQPFRCYKFRSMYPDAEERLRTDHSLFAQYVANDYKLPAHVDPRITPIGRVLRATSLDELPQLWNVLRGDMSLVGPRPIVRDEIRQYEQEGLFLLALRPGMTGAWQVSGRSDLSYPARTLVELEYIANWSIFKDLCILAQTIPAVLRRRGAY